MEASVIIPTYNRAGILLETLNHLSMQDYPKSGFEVIVINDGSTDNTAEEVDAFASSHTELQLRHYEQANRGPSVARNVGISQSTGNLIILIGDDILCPPSFIRDHLTSHGGHDDLSISGPQVWTTHPNPFMKLLADNARGATSRKEIGMSGFCTANVSIKRHWLETSRFDEGIKMGYEDTELGYRLAKRGVRLCFDPLPLVHHKHHYDLEAFRRKMKMHGKSSLLLLAKHPELRRNLIPHYFSLKKRVCKLLLGTGIIQHISGSLHANMEGLVSYVEGIEEGLAYSARSNENAN